MRTLRIVSALALAFTLVATPAMAQSRRPDVPIDPRRRDDLPQNKPTRIDWSNKDTDNQTREMRLPNGDFDNEYNSRVLLENGAAIDRYSLALEVADCLAKRDAHADEKVGGPLSDDPQFKNLSKALQRRYASCVTKNTVGAPMSLVNGALGEVLIERARLRASDKQMPRDIAAAQAFYLRPGGPTIETVGRCLAVFSPGLGLKLLETRPGVVDEAKALDALYAATPECGVPAKPKDIAGWDQRAAIATGMFHWMQPGKLRETGGEEVPVNQ